jgi:hypothetical protein
MLFRMLRALALCLVLAGCGSSAPSPGSPDLASAPADSGADGGSADGGLPFGSPCTGNADCASMLCFIGGNRTFCSIHCTMATAATDCPIPPTSGVCNMQGYCKP